MSDKRYISAPDSIRKMITLLLNDLRLTATEKLSKLITTFAVVFIVGLLGLGVLLFLSYSMAAFLSTIIPEGFACMIVAGMYLLFIIVVIIFRIPLLENPVTRLISKTILPGPIHKTHRPTPVKLQDHDEE